MSETIYEDELIHVFVDRLPCEMASWIEKYIDRSTLKAANNTKFYLKPDLDFVFLSYPPNHKYYYIIEESLT